MTAAGTDEEAPILLATDFSEDSEAAFAWAARAAQAFEAPLHVLHVVHDPLDDPGAYAGSDDSPLEKLEDVAREMLDAWVERMASEQQDGAPATIDIVSSIVVGLPETRIVEVADREEAQLIVMGGRGRTRLANILLGSRAEQVVRRAAIPVTIVRGAAASDDPNAEDASTRRVP